MFTCCDYQKNYEKGEKSDDPKDDDSSVTFVPPFSGPDCPFGIELFLKHHIRNLYNYKR